MNKVLLFVIMTLSFGNSYCQTEIDIRSSAYAIGKQDYRNGDYVDAYRYLLAYKYSHYDQLNSADNKEAFEGLNKAILYCEAQIKRGLSSFSSYEGRGYSQTEVEAAKRVTITKPPLSDTHL
jgi:hypothetical protein